MSNSASISAAKKRRGGAPPPPVPLQNGGAQNMGLPPGLPPNFRQLPPHIQQQLFQQLQQKANAAAASKVAPPPVAVPVNPQYSPQVGPGGPANSTVNIQGPYTVNSVIHNRAMAEVNGVHIRDLPISSAGLPCSPTGAALPPNVLFKLHHDELLNMDAVLNEHSNKIQMLSNRLDKSEGVVSRGNTPAQQTQPSVQQSQSQEFAGTYESLVNNTDFITKILDNILSNTNLSDIINQIEPLQKENESLRALLNSQQVTLNELSGLVMKLLANGLPSYHSDAVLCMNEETHEDNAETNVNESGNHDHGSHDSHNNNDEEAEEHDTNTHNNYSMEYSVYIPEGNGDVVSDQQEPYGVGGGADEASEY
jgi:hypothetical protein